MLLAQAKRAFDFYDNDLQLERQLKGAKAMLATLEKKPEGFNSPMGFLLVIDLDDASRNAALCGGQAAEEAATNAIAGDTNSGLAKLNIATSCMWSVGSTLALRRWRDEHTPWRQEEFKITSVADNRYEKLCKPQALVGEENQPHRKEAQYYEASRYMSAFRFNPFSTAEDSIRQSTGVVQEIFQHDDANLSDSYSARSVPDNHRAG